MTNSGKDLCLGIIGIITIILTIILIFKTFILIASLFNPIKLLGTVCALIVIIIIYCNIVYK